MSRYRLAHRVPSTVAIIAMASGGRSCEVKGVLSSPQSGLLQHLLGCHEIVLLCASGYDTRNETLLVSAPCQPDQLCPLERLYNSDRCHGEMYFDIVPVYYHRTRKQRRTHTPNREPRTQQNQQEEEVGAIPSVGSRCTVQQTRHGSSMLVGVRFFPRNFVTHGHRPLQIGHRVE